MASSPVGSQDQNLGQRNLQFDSSGGLRRLKLDRDDKKLTSAQKPRRLLPAVERANNPAGG
jgi:hypothetical protein